MRELERENGGMEPHLRERVFKNGFSGHADLDVLAESIRL